MLLNTGNFTFRDSSRGDLSRGYPAHSIAWAQGQAAGEMPESATGFRGFCHAAGADLHDDHLAAGGVWRP